MALQVAELFKIPVNRVAVRVSGWNLTHESDGTINDYGIGSNTYMILLRISRLWSTCDECKYKNDCSFLEKFEEWQRKTWKNDNIVISTEAYFNVYLKYNLSDKIRDRIERNHESPFVRFGDAAHHAFHHNENYFKWDEITKIALKN